MRATFITFVRRVPSWVESNAPEEEAAEIEDGELRAKYREIYGRHAEWMWERERQTPWGGAI